MSDYYEKSAEFIDMMIRPWWDGPGSLLTGALKGMEEVQGPIVDVGAGSGLAVHRIDADYPEAEFLAVEPSPAMRCALLARVLAHDDLRDRATVLPMGLLDAALPETVRAFVLMNVIGHFSPDERARVWDLIAATLAPNGRAVVNLAPPFTPTTIPQTAMADVAVGRNRYQGWAEAEPAGADRLTWRMTYTTLTPDQSPREIAVTYDWWTLTPEQLIAETAEHGLEVSPHGEPDSGFFVLRAPGE